MIILIINAFIKCKKHDITIIIEEDIKMDKHCKNPKELAEAIKNGEDSIVVEGDLKNKIIRIKVTGKLSWSVCAVALGAAIMFYIATPEATVATAPAGGAGGAISFTGGVVATTAAATTLGSAVFPAVAIGVAAGGIGALNTLRDKYDIVEKNSNYIKLKKK